MPTAEQLGIQKRKKKSPPKAPIQVPRRTQPGSSVPAAEPQVQPRAGTPAARRGSPKSYQELTPSQQKAVTKRARRVVKAKRQKEARRGARQAARQARSAPGEGNSISLLTEGLDRYNALLKKKAANMEAKVPNPPKGKPQITVPRPHERPGKTQVALHTSGTVRQQRALEHGRRAASERGRVGAAEMAALKPKRSKNWLEKTLDKVVGAGADAAEKLPGAGRVFKYARSKDGQEGLKLGAKGLSKAYRGIQSLNRQGQQTGVARQAGLGDIQKAVGRAAKGAATEGLDALMKAGEVTDYAGDKVAKATGLEGSAYHLALEIGLDPTTYLGGAGAYLKGAKAAQRSAEALRKAGRMDVLESKAVRDAFEHATKTMDASPLRKTLDEALAEVGPRALTRTQRAAKAAEQVPGYTLRTRRFGRSVDRTHRLSRGELREAAAEQGSLDFSRLRGGGVQLRLGNPLNPNKGRGIDLPALRVPSVGGLQNTRLSLRKMAAPAAVAKAIESTRQSYAPQFQELGEQLRNAPTKEKAAVRAQIKALQEEADMAVSNAQRSVERQRTSVAERFRFRQQARDIHNQMRQGVNVQTAMTSQYNRMLTDAVKPIRGGKGATERMERVQAHLWAWESRNEDILAAHPLRTQAERDAFENLKTVYRAMLEQGQELGYLGHGLDRYAARSWGKADAQQALDETFARVGTGDLNAERSTLSVWGRGSREDAAAHLQRAFPEMDPQDAIAAADRLHATSFDREISESLARQAQRGHPAQFDELDPVTQRAVQADANADHGVLTINEGKVMLRPDVADPELEQELANRMRGFGLADDEIDEVARFNQDLSDEDRYEMLQRDLTQAALRQKQAALAGDSETAALYEAQIARLDREATAKADTASEIEPTIEPQIEQFADEWIIAEIEKQARTISDVLWDVEDSLGRRLEFKIGHNPQESGTLGVYDGKEHSYTIYADSFQQMSLENGLPPGPALGGRIRQNMIHELAHARTMQRGSALHDMVMTNASAIHGIGRVKLTAMADAKARKFGAYGSEEFHTARVRIRQQMTHQLVKEVLGEDYWDNLMSMRRLVRDMDIKGLSAAGVRARRELDTVGVNDAYAGQRDRMGTQATVATESTARLTELAASDPDRFVEVVGQDLAHWFTNDVLKVQLGDLQPTGRPLSEEAAKRVDVGVSSKGFAFVRGRAATRSQVEEALAEADARAARAGDFEPPADSDAWASHTLEHAEGQRGYGYLTRDGDVRTWTEDGRNHADVAAANGEVPAAHFYIGENGVPEGPFAPDDLGKSGRVIERADIKDQIAEALGVPFRERKPSMPAMKRAAQQGPLRGLARLDAQVSARNMARLSRRGGPRDPATLERLGKEALDSSKELGLKVRSKRINTESMSWEPPAPRGARFERPSRARFIVDSDGKPHVWDEDLMTHEQYRAERGVHVKGGGYALEGFIDSAGRYVITKPPISSAERLGGVARVKRILEPAVEQRYGLRAKMRGEDSPGALEAGERVSKDGQPFVEDSHSMLANLFKPGGLAERMNRPYTKAEIRASETAPDIGAEARWGDTDIGYDPNPLTHEEMQAYIDWAKGTGPDPAEAMDIPSLHANEPGPVENPLDLQGRLPDVRSKTPYYPITNPLENAYWRSHAQARTSAFSVQWKEVDRKHGRSMNDSALRSRAGGTEWVDDTDGQVYVKPTIHERSLDNYIGEHRVWPVHVMADVRDSFNRMSDYDRVTAEGIAAGFDRVMTSARFWVTQPIPAYHIRNMISDTIKSLQADSGVLFHPIGNFQLLRAAAFRSGGKIDVPGVGKMKTEDFLLFADSFGIRSGEALADFGRIVGQNPNLDVNGLQRALRLSQHAALSTGARREDIMRMMTWIQRMRRNGGDAGEAAVYMIRHHFDYGDLSKFERRFVRNVFLFYTWYRKNIPLQLLELGRRPGFFTGVSHNYQAAAEGRSPINQDWPGITGIPFLPDTSGELPRSPLKADYITERMAGLGLNWNGHAMYLGFGAPWADLGFLADPAHWAGTVNPLVGAAYELQSRKDSFTNRQLRPREPGIIANLGDFLGFDLPKDQNGKPILPWWVQTIEGLSPGFSRAGAASLKPDRALGNLGTGITTWDFPKRGTPEEKEQLQIVASAIIKDWQGYLRSISNETLQERDRMGRAYARENIIARYDAPVIKTVVGMVTSQRKTDPKTFAERYREAFKSSAVFSRNYDLKASVRRRKKEKRGGTGASSTYVGPGSAGSASPGGTYVAPGAASGGTF